MAKCVKCEKPILLIKAQDIAIQWGRQFNWIAYCCPLCDTVLSVMIDQIALKIDTVNDTIKWLKGF